MSVYMAHLAVVRSGQVGQCEAVQVSHDDDGRHAQVHRQTLVLGVGQVAQETLRRAHIVAALHHDGREGIIHICR